MPLALTTRGHNMVLGALIADAASMGLHWLYDQDHIHKIAPKEPEFCAPVRENYTGVPGYFAHSKLQTGDQTQYGAQLIVLLKALETSDGIYNASTYKQAFREYFGYGGDYVGYIDFTTRETLDNLRRAADEAQHRAAALPFDGDEMVTVAMVTKVTSLIGKLSGDALRDAFIEAAQITHAGDKAALAHGLQVFEEIIAMPTASGAYDQQLPAISKLPALIAAYEASGQLDNQATFDAIDSVVQSTNDHPCAIAYGRVTAVMMMTALKNDNIDAILAAGRQHATPEIAKLLDDAMAHRSSNTNEIAKHFGLACDLNYGVPIASHIIATAPNYREAIRRNIYAGGDSCGRSILIGALLGAIHGVGGDTGIPPSWITQLNNHPL